QVLLPARIAPVVPSVEGEQGVVRCAIPRIETKTRVTRPEPIAEIVATPAGAHEEGAEQRRPPDHVPRPEAPARRQVPPRPAKPDRREQQTAIGQRIIPIAAHVQTAAGGPDISGGAPHPARVIAQPVAGPPQETNTPD